MADLWAILGGKPLAHRMSGLYYNLDFYKRRGLSASPVVRKLSYFADKETKMRVIAVGDYYSQTALRPLHSYLFRALKKIPQDCTFDQGAGVERLKNQEWFSSVDLSNATDRFPIKLISQLLRAKLPSRYVEAWELLMVSYPFIGLDKSAPSSLQYW